MNEDNKVESGKLIDSNEIHNIPDKIEERETRASKPHIGYDILDDSRDVKPHKEFREGLGGRKKETLTHAKPKLSKHSTTLSLKSQVTDLAGPSGVQHAEIAQTTKNSESPTFILALSGASNTSGSIRGGEENKAKQGGFFKESYQPHKLTHRLASVQPNQSNKILRASMHKQLPQQNNDPVNESTHKESNQLQSHKTSRAQASAQPVLTSELPATQLNNELIQSYKTTYAPHLTPVEPTNPDGTTKPHGPVQSVYSNSQYIEGVSTTLRANEALLITEKAQKTIEKTNSKQCSLETDINKIDNEQPLYIRTSKKLPTVGPLAINDLDEFLKKSKIDFQHVYHKKPISSVKIADFNVIKTLGVGGFGKVLLGELKTDKTLYALKIIDKVGVVKRNHARYVSNEKKILQALNFPFVINLKYFFTDLYYLYFVMPYVPGGNLSRHLKIRRKLNESEAQFYIGQLVLALEYLHYLELIHRDVKTENIMIDAFGYLKLVDFGQCIRCHSHDKKWTYTGTPEYMAPEIIAGKGYDCAVDWWALGIITFEICAGFRPFKHENAYKLQLLILCNQYSTPSGCSRSLRKLIGSLLVLEPKKRIANNSTKASIIKKHVWFKGMNWLALLNRTLEAPYLPNLSKISQLHPEIYKKDH